MRKRRVGAAMARSARRGGRSALIRARRMRPKVNKSNVMLGLGFPKKITATHKYNEVLALNTGAAGLTNSVYYSCNGMYDPNVTGTGHQPYYFDQLGALYDQYVVIGAKIKLKFSKTPLNTDHPTICGVLINDDASGNADINTLMENSNVRWGMLSTGNPVLTLTKNWSAKKNFGGSILGNNALAGTTGSNPNEVQNFQVFINSEQGAVQTGIAVAIEITYIAVWTELKDISGS